MTILTILLLVVIIVLLVALICIVHSIKTIKKKNEKKYIITTEDLLKERLQKYIKNGSLSPDWGLIYDIPNPTGKTKGIGRILGNSIICFDKKYEDKLRKFANDINMCVFETRYEKERLNENKI